MYAILVLSVAMVGFSARGQMTDSYEEFVKKWKNKAIADCDAMAVAVVKENKIKKNQSLFLKNATDWCEEKYTEPSAKCLLDAANKFEAAKGVDDNKRADEMKSMSSKCMNELQIKVLTEMKVQAKDGKFN